MKCEWQKNLIYALDMRPMGFPYRRYGTEKHVRGEGDMDQKKNSVPRERGNGGKPLESMHTNACS